MDHAERFEQELSRLEISTDSKHLIALSGGGDSVALLYLCSLIPRYRGKFQAARVTHGIRSSSEENEEIAFCTRLCRDKHLEFTVLEDVDNSPAAIADAQGCGPEQAARTYRHRLLEQHRASVGADTILFGHTADDQRETVLMRVLSGSGFEGLRGIPSIRGPIRRPLLTFERQELRDLLNSAGIVWHDDATNDSADYLRNRLRRELIPLVADIFPGWKSSMEILRQRADESADALDSNRKIMLPKQIERMSVSWPWDSWQQAPDYYRSQALWEAFNLLLPEKNADRRIPWRTLKEARDSIEKGFSWQGWGFILERKGSRVILAASKILLNGRVIVRPDDIGRIFSLGEVDVVIDRFLPSAIDLESAESDNEESESSDGNVGAACSTVEMPSHDQWPLEVLVDFGEKGLQWTLRSLGNGELLAESSNNRRKRPVKTIIKEKSSFTKLPDADDNINYIYIKVSEALNARRQE